MALQARLVVVPGRHPHPSLAERDGGRVGVAVGAQVDPDEVRRLQRPHPGLREVGREQLGQQPALAVEPLDQRRPATRRTRVYAATAATTPSGDHESLSACGAASSRSRAAWSGTTSWAQRSPAVLNAFDAATTATVWSAVPSMER